MPIALMTGYPHLYRMYTIYKRSELWEIDGSKLSGNYDPGCMKLQKQTETTVKVSKNMKKDTMKQLSFFKCKKNNTTK